MIGSFIIDEREVGGPEDDAEVDDEDVELEGDEGKINEVDDGPHAPVDDQSGPQLLAQSLQTLWKWLALVESHSREVDACEQGRVDELIEGHALGDHGHARAWEEPGQHFHILHDHAGRSHRGSEEAAPPKPRQV